MPVQGLAISTISLTAMWFYASALMMVLGGIFPVSQVREPYSTVGYLAERLNLPKLLRIKPLDEDIGEDTYKCSDICEVWAEMRGFLTAKAARLDTCRSANNLLRMALDGRICPKGYVKQKDFRESHSDTAAFIDLQTKTDRNVKLLLSQIRKMLTHLYQIQKNRRMLKSSQKEHNLRQLQ